MIHRSMHHLAPTPRQVMQDTLNTVSAGPSNTVRRVEEGELLEVLDGPQEARGIIDVTLFGKKNGGFL